MSIVEYYWCGIISVKFDYALMTVVLFSEFLYILGVSFNNK